MLKDHLLAPLGRLVIAGVFALMVVLALLWQATHQPWLGLSLVWQEDAALVVRARGPAAAVPVGTKVRQVSGNNAEHVLQPYDLLREPDGNVPGYSDYYTYLRHLDLLSHIQRGDRLSLVTVDGGHYLISPEPRRPLRTLPPEFWVHLTVGVFAWLIAAAVWAFRPGDAAVRYLLLSGFATLMFAPGAGVYATRELGMSLNSMLILKTMNFGGGLLYCGVMVSLLLHYPRQLAHARVGIAIVLAFIGWFLIQATGVFESMLLGRRLPVFISLLGTVVLAVVQWVGTRRDPVARASLQWFLLAWVMCTSLFIILTMVPQLYGVSTDVVQGYAFLLFILVYAGLAFGITRYRLFDLGEWWFRALSWFGGALLLIALDMLLVYGLHLSGDISLVLALLICGLVWLPFRQWLWQRLIQRYVAPEQNLFRDIVAIALAPQLKERGQRWIKLLTDTFRPLSVELLTEDITRASLVEHGRALRVPGVVGVPACELNYADAGRRLFGSRDIALVLQMIDMLGYADSSRDAYQRGASGERERIRRDIHDDIGARLLTLLHTCSPEHRPLIREALDDARALVKTMEMDVTDSAQALEHWQAEIRQRCEAAGVELHWQQFESDQELVLTPREYSNLTRILREAVSNALRHGTPDNVTIVIEANASGVVALVRDDGDAAPAEQWVRGRGCNIMQERAREIGAEVSWQVAQGCSVTVRFERKNTAPFAAGAGGAGLV